MANAKSNIYPVQLQGAELNLNKYDAEIKQYSGFNKNNSPFVGGCLSNIFTKDETIEGASSENTYIDTDKNVYKVTETGLFKNDVKLIDTEGKDFYDVEDLGLFFFENTVYVYDEDTYIYGANNKLYYHSGKVEIEITHRDAERVMGFKYYVTKQNIFNTEYEFVLFRYTAYTQSVGWKAYYMLYILKKDTEGELDYNYSEEIQLVASDLEYWNIPSIHFSEENNNTIRFTVIGCVSNSQGSYKYGKLYNFDGSNVTFIRDLSVYFRNSATAMSGDIFRSCVFTHDFVSFSCIGSSALIIKDTLKCNYSVDFSDESTSGIHIDMDKPIESASNVAYLESARTHFAKSWGVLAAASVSNNENSFKAFSIDDEVTTYAKLVVRENSGTVIGSSAYFLIGGLVNECVLTNNATVSGISLPGGWILASEWNTVDVNYIFFGENTQEFKNSKYVCIWKNVNNGHWYKLVKSTPKLKLLNNQLIINSNTIFNSYDITKGKVLLFAPAWNNRHPNRIADYAIYTRSDVFQHFASVINAYALEDNASLILNPVEIYYDAPVGTSELSDGNSFIFVDFYKDLGSTSTEVLYRYSLAINKSGDTFYAKNDKNVYLDVTGFEISLPFPSNTDGNIQYSPSLFAVEKGKYGNLVFISENGTAYKLMTYNNRAVMSYFLSTAIEGLQDFFTIQGQLYGNLNNGIYGFSIINEVANRGDFIVNVENLQFVGNTPYEALFFSKTNRCLYSFTGANVLSQKQLVDKISEVRDYLYNPATQTVFLITDIGVLFYGLFGQFLLEYTDISKIFLLNNGIVMSDNAGHYRYIKYYLDEGDTDFEKHNINFETCFYGMNNQTVTINDCLYMRIFSEEHEEGELEVSATTLSLEGRMTEKTTFKIKASDWDAITHTIYLRYQPKEQRGLGISFSINSPFKIASLSVGSQADAILVDKVSKSAINAPQRTSNNVEW